MSDNLRPLLTPPSNKKVPPMQIATPEGVYDVPQVAVVAITPNVVEVIAKAVAVQLSGTIAAGLGLQLVAKPDDESAEPEPDASSSP